MKLSSAHLAGTVAAAYVAIILGGILLHFFNTGNFHTLWYSLTLPATVAAVCLSSLVAWGLWSRYAWAWWLGLVAVVYQLYRMSSWFVARLNGGHASTASWIIAGLLVAFLCLLLLRGTRRACTR